MTRTQHVPSGLVHFAPSILVDSPCMLSLQKFTSNLNCPKSCPQHYLLNEDGLTRALTSLHREHQVSAVETLYREKGATTSNKRNDAFLWESSTKETLVTEAQNM